jgi:DNA processing protein
MARTLLARFGGPAEVLDAPHGEIARIAGMSAASALLAGPDPAMVEATLRWLEHESRHFVPLGDACYPPPLLEIEDPPMALYAEGQLERLAAPAFAIVGSRNATVQGLQDARAFAEAIGAAGLGIMSGLALGIDAAAHRGGLSQAGSSLAVMGTGPDIYYPRGNRELARELASHGCLLTEFPVGTPPLKANFPRRNRLISGMSRGVLVVEAAVRSGSLTTARLALEQGREVFAIPGSIHSPLSKGCHWLIKEGAKLVESAEDILVELGWKGTGVRKAGRDPIDESDPLLLAMGDAPISFDQVAERTNMGAAAVSAGISRLEMEGRVAALAGGLFQRVRPVQ